MAFGEANPNLRVYVQIRVIKRFKFGCALEGMMVNGFLSPQYFSGGSLQQLTIRVKTRDVKMSEIWLRGERESIREPKMHVKVNGINLRRLTNRKFGAYFGLYFGHLMCGEHI